MLWDLRFLEPDLRISIDSSTTNESVLSSYPNPGGKRLLVKKKKTGGSYEKDRQK
jgi:hypothetical protein